MKTVSSPIGHSLPVMLSISVSVSPPGRSVRPTLPANSTSPTKARLRLGAVEDDVPRRVPGAVAHRQRALPDLHRIAVVQPARRREGLGRREAEHLRLLAQAVDPELVGRVWSDDGQLQLARQRAGAAGMVDVGVGEQDLLERHAQRRAASRMRGRSPPGSMTAPSMVWSHQTMEQFCWNGVTGMVS